MMEAWQHDTTEHITGCTNSDITPIYLLLCETFNQCMWMNATHIHLFTEPSNHSLRRLHIAPARTSRTNLPHTTSAHYLQAKLDSLHPIKQNMSLETNTHMQYTPKAKEWGVKSVTTGLTFVANTPLNSILSPNAVRSMHITYML